MGPVENNKAPTLENNKAPTLESLLRENSNIILECLEISGFIYSRLTSGNSKSSEVKLEPDCMMTEALMQNDNLKLLEKQLLDLKTTILN